MTVLVVILLHLEINSKVFALAKKDILMLLIHQFAKNVMPHGKISKFIINSLTCNTNNLENACTSCDEKSVLHPTP